MSEGTGRHALPTMAALRDPVGRWGDMATVEQWADAEAILSLDGPRRHWLGRSKGYSKTRDVAAMSLAVLLTQMPPGASAYVAASDGDQAGLVRQSIAAYVAATPGLAREVTVESRRVVATGKGTELVTLAADTAGSHGLRPHLVVVDELGNWPDIPGRRDFFDYLWAGLPKVPGSRGVIMTTAGSPAHFSRKIYEVAASDPSWRLSDLHGPAPWIDAAEVEAERRRLLPSVFARLWANEWAAPEDSVADPGDIDAAMVLEGPLAPVPGRSYAVTLDLGARNDRTAAAIGHAVAGESGTRAVVDRLQVWEPRPGFPVSLDEVRLWLAEFARSYNGATVLYDPSQAYLLIEQLRQAGVACREFVFTSSSVGRLATALVTALRGRLLDLPVDDALRDELLSVRLREGSVPGVLRLDHVAGRHDDRAVVLGMLCEQLTREGADDWSSLYGVLARCGSCGRDFLTGEAVGRGSEGPCPFCGRKQQVREAASHR